MQYLIIFAAILPAFALVIYVYLRDKYEREPLSQVLKAVGYGVISAGIAYVLEVIIGGMGITGQAATWVGALWNAFVGAAIPEEAAKLLMLWLLLRHNPHFDERFDGIVYACCVGMGFAGTENILYLLGNIDCWQMVAVQRAIFAVPGHFFFAVAMGYFYSQISFRDLPAHKKSRIFIVPVLLHGIYDGLLMMAEVSPILGGALVLIFYVFCFQMFKYGRRRIREQAEQSNPDNIKFF